MNDKTQAVASDQMREAKSFRLNKSGVDVLYDGDPSVAQVLAAQKASGKDSALFVLYLAQATATFNGERWTMGQIREKIRGKDYLALAAEMLGDDKDEDATSGN
jgi:hypothetical protein